MHRLLLSLALLLQAVAAGAGEGIRVEASPAGSAVRVSARAEIRAPLSLIWGTLTDYDHLSSFIPGIRTSRVIDRRGPAAIVAQNGEARFLFFRYPLDVVVESAEYPPHVITVRVLKGNLRQLDGGYRIETTGTDGLFVLTWTGIIEPDTILPRFVTMPLMRANIEDQFVGMVREIERRDTARRGSPASGH